MRIGAPPAMNYQIFIKTAITKLLRETHADYRCERDLHHHLTACIESVQPGLFGSPRRVQMECPTQAQYSWSRRRQKRGNLDYFFHEESAERIVRFTPRGHDGTALELNFNYDDVTKIKQDLIKLIDPRNSHQESVYFVYAVGSGFKALIESALERALHYFENLSDHQLLPSDLHIVLAEGQRRVGTLRYLEVSTVRACALSDLKWVEYSLRPKVYQPMQRVVHSEHARGLEGRPSLNVNFDPSALAELLREFRGRIKRQIDSSLADSLERELLGTPVPQITAKTMNQLARWCKTNGSPYQDGMAIAKSISLLLFGEVLDRSDLVT